MKETLDFKKVAARFPELKVEADALYIRDDKFYTSAGITGQEQFSEPLKFQVTATSRFAIMDIE